VYAAFQANKVVYILVIEQLLQPPPQWSAPWMHQDLLSSFAPPSNKSWRRHCSDLENCAHKPHIG